MTRPAPIFSKKPMTLSEDVVWCEQKRVIYIFHPGRGEYFSLKGVGAFVWKALAQPRRFHELCAMVQHKYNVDGAKSAEDLRDLLQELHAQNHIAFR